MAQYHRYNGHVDGTDDTLRAHDLIEAHMVQAPSAPSVCAWDGEWTYGELDGHSSALASRLVACGVGRDDFVPLLVPKSKWTAVAVLAVMRSGAAFVLLDEAHPQRRLREMCAEMRAPLVVAAEDLRDRAAQLIEGGPVLVVGASPPPSPSPSGVPDDKAWRAVPVTGLNALYAIFTSGSTGKPKGAVVEHASLCAAALASGRVLDMSAQSRAFQFASFAFDPTIMDFLRTWIHGGCVCIPSAQQAKDDITGAFTALQANMASLTPSVARMLNADALPGLRVLEFAGEPMLPADVEKWADRVVLVNAYGNAECSVYSIMRCPVRRDIPVNNIGYPVACVAWIVDETDPKILLPPGQTGELVLEGPGIGRGYLHNAAMTAASFIIDPPWLATFRNTTGTRLYKTGDLARYEQDGSLLCLGRKDTQTKIRGQRVELSEVEWHIRDQLEAGEDVVAEVVRWHGARDDRTALVACVRLHQAPNERDSEQTNEILAPPTEAFRRKMEGVERGLHSRVPSYMVPSVFVALKRVPLSLSGKTDRRRLRDHIAQTPWAEVEAYMLAGIDGDQTLAPATEGQRRLRNAFAHVLGIGAETIGLHDSFFRRGGDSILAMRLSACCRSQGLSVTTQDIFQHKTIASLDDVIVSQIGQPFPLSSAQHLLIHRHERAGNEIRRDLGLYSFHVMRMPGSLQISQLESALQSLIRRHPVLRTTFFVDISGHRAQVTRELPDGCYSCIPVHIPASKVDTDHTAWDPHFERLNLRNGPLLLAHLVNIEGMESQYLHLATPKVVADHHSWDIIARDMLEYLESRDATTHVAAGSFQSWLAASSIGDVEATHILPSLFELEHTGASSGARPLHFVLDARTATELWKTGADIFRADPKELFIGVLFHSLQSIFPEQKDVFVIVEHDGRTRHVAHEVGQFATYTSLILSSTDTDLLSIVSQAKDAFRAASRRPDLGRRRAGQTSIVLHWITKGDLSESAAESEIEMRRVFQPSLLRTRHEQPTTSLQPATLDVTVTCTEKSPSLQVQLINAQDELTEDTVHQWFEYCRTSLVEFPRQWGEVQLQPQVRDFFQLDMSQESLSYVIEDLAQNHGLGMRDIDGIYSVAFIQQGMLLSQARRPWTYQSSITWAVRSSEEQPVDLARLRNAWKRVAMAHSILRTIFVQTRDGSYYQVVLKNPPLAIMMHYLDDPLSAPPMNGWRENEKPILPWRINLVGSECGTIINCGIHISHALMDGDSMRVMVRDAILAYDGESHALEPPRYGQYIEYLRQIPQEPALEYWKTYLRDVEPCLFPSSDSIEPQVAVEPLRDIEIFLDDAPRLRQFCDTEGVTLFNVIQLAWAIVLQCYTGNNAPVFGYLASGRNIPLDGAEDIVGPLINMLVSRVNLDRGVSVRHGLAQCRDRFTESLPHQHCALSDIYRVLGHSGAWLFNTIITYQKDVPMEENKSIDFEKIRDKQPTEFDVVVNVIVSRDRIDISLTHGVGKLSAAISSSLGRTFNAVIAEIVARPDDSVSELDLVSAPDLACMLAWNSPPAVPVNEAAQDQIQEMCLHCPERLAVDAWDGSLTYLQLWDHATRLAAVLRSHGLKSEMPVPICLEKSFWGPVCMLAILLAGGVCVPIDPEAHLERVQAIINETSPSIILVSPKTSEMDFVATSKRVVISSDLLTFSSGQEDATKTVNVKPDNAAFMLFTSGSTGRPKGIIMQHDSLSTTLREQRVRLLIDSASRVLHFASYTFDISVYEVLTTLTAGGCVCIPSDAARVNDLPGFIRDSRVNWMISTPSLFRLFRPETIINVRTVVLAGEPIPQDIVDLWAGRVQLFNGYGPAECTICTTHKIEAETWIPGTIGRPAGGEAWVVDQFNVNRLVPVGAVGELLFQGPVVARGYFQQPDATEKAFLPSQAPWLPASFSEGRGALYRTGDLVSYNADGTLRYLGRKDAQIKLRGQRIELEGIEDQIRRHLPVDHGVVVDAVQMDDQTTAKLLVAFIQRGLRDEHIEVELMAAEESFRALVHGVHAKLVGEVPNYMIPQLMISVTRIPMSKTGKTDRRFLRGVVSALSRAELERMVQGQDGPKPQPTTPAEQAMQGLWAVVLGRPVETLGIQDDFFQAGGDSITAMKLVGLVRAEGYSLAVSDVFNRPTLAGLAAGLEKAASLPRSLQYVPFSLVPPDDGAQELRQIAMESCGVASDVLEDIYPCTALQEGLMSLTIKQQGSYVAQYEYELGRDIDSRQMGSAWDTVVAANPILRTRIIQASSGRLFQVVLKHGIACSLQYSGLEEAKRNVREQHIGLGTPLMRCFMAIEGSTPRLVLTIHHAVYDGWSMTLLLEQLESIYKGVKPKMHSFTGFIDYVGRMDLAACRQFWRTYFEGVDTVLFPTPQGRDSLALEASKMQLVEQRQNIPAACSRFTLSTTVRLAWALVLAKHTASQDVVFGATVAGRSAPVDCIEEMTGPTIATVPLRVQIRPSSTVEQCLEDVQRQTIAMVPYEGTGLHRIQAFGADATVACEFQNLLVVQQQGSFYQPKLLQEVHRSTDNIAAINTYPLTLLCNLNGDHVLTQASFDPQVLDAAKVKLLVSQFHNVILQLLGPMSLCVAEIVLDGDKTLQQLKCWNEHIPPALDATVDALIACHFESQSKASAVHAWDGDLSYEELNDMSAQLALKLVQRGVGPDVIVPLYLEKCRWTPLAIMAVLRAGGAFVLLDPAHPPDRLKSITSQLDAAVLLSMGTLSSTAGHLASDILYLDQLDWNDAHNGALVTLPHKTGAQNRLYVVFTSGTTGIPKGVVIEHGAFLTSMFAIQDTLGLGPSTRAMQAAAYAFDVAVFDHLAVLLSGGCLCIPRTTQIQSDLGGAIRELQADYVMITPSMAELFRPEDVPCLRTLALIGEPMTAALVATWADCVTLLNTYGPAECSVICSVLGPIQRQSHHYANIGFATGSASWVVDKDDHEKLAPMGTAGELLVEGPILARGYLHDEAKTSASFIFDPQWARSLLPGHSPRRFYKTGDLVQYQPEDGSLLYIGRKDTQVKIRGQRIELGEIEYHVKNGFAEAVRLIVDVFTPAGEGSMPMLAAFVQMALPFANLMSTPSTYPPFAMDNETFSACVESLLRRLRDKLPAAMLPAVFFPVMHIPLAATGKADRRKLKDAASRFTQADVRRYMLAEKSKRSPASATERLVQSICGRVLKMPIEDIGMNDSFIQLGGHSISAIHFTGHVRSAGWAVELVHVISEPTLADLAGKLRPSKATTTLSCVAPFSLVGGENKVSDMRRLAADACSVALDNIEDVYPATPLQVGLLALSLKRPGSYQAYIYLNLAAHGGLEKLKRAWETTVAAHCILRTRFFQGADGELYQTVVKTGVPWHAATRGDDSLPKAARLTVTMGGALIRATVVQEPGQAQAVLVLTLHHALYDGWSLPLLFQDLQSAYQGHALTKCPFNGFVAYLRQSNVAEMSDFWKTELQGLSSPPFPVLPTVRYAPKATEVLEHTLDYSHASPEFTPSTILRLAWAATISSYTGLDDVVFGSTVAGRSAPVPGIEATTGPTIATVPFRVRVDPKQRTQNALEALRTRSMQMIRFEQAGLQQICTWSPEAAVACQFQSLLVIQWMEPPESGAAYTDFVIDAKSANDDTAFSSYAINITCELFASSIKFCVAYDPAVTAPGVMSMMLAQMVHATSRIMANCSLVKDTLTISPEGMSSLSRWNTIPPAESRCVHDMILRHSQITPDAVAVKAWDGQLTYGQLAVEASRVAAMLRRHAQGHEPIVPLLFEKTMWTVVGILGTLLAGNAFLLLDPTQPAARLHLLCDIVGAKVVLASEKQASLAATVAPHATVQVCSDVAICESDMSEHAEAPPPSDPSLLLYCVFTSGSTGTPKGVLIEHASFCASIAGVCRVLPFGPTTRVFQFASYAFDVGITDHLVPLMVGGSIYIPRPEDVKNNFAACLRESEATYLELVPSVARTLDKDVAAKLEIIALSGEAKTSADVERWKGRLTSGYGPAECSAASHVQFPVTPEDHPQALGVETGGASWVVDPDDIERLVPVGAVGELIIEGPIVGRGYLQDPERTAAAFIEPMQWLKRLRGDIQPRVYVTGDLVQLLPTGDLRFVGRKDHQVKVRGQRVELGEVETYLHPLFPQATNVIVEVLKPLGREDRAFLTAFVDYPNPLDQYDGHVHVGEMALLPPSLSFVEDVQKAERQLRDTVPAYMIPALFLPVSHFKLSTSDKVDRKALRALGNSQPWEDLQAYSKTRGHRRAPETEMQQVLVNLCAKVLNENPEEISIDDGFLSLGGDSISAMSLVARGNAQGIRFTVADVLSQSSLEKLAVRTQRDDSMLPVLSHPEGKLDVPFALSPIQKMFFAGMPPHLLNHFNQSFYVALTQRIVPSDVQRAVHVLVRRHAMLQARFYQVNGEWMQVIPSELNAPLFQLSNVSDVEAVEPTVLKTQQSLDIDKGILFAVHLFDIENHGQHMLLVAHHLVVDHVAWRVILADLEQLLRVKSSHDIEDSKPSMSFQTWCHLQDRFVHEHLQPLVTAPDTVSEHVYLPAEFLRYWGLVNETNTYADVVSTGFDLSPGATISFLKDANTAFQTRPVEILQAALIFSFIQAFPDRMPPVIHNEGHGREAWDASIDLSRVVGWFTTIWPTPAVVQHGQSIFEAVKRIKDARRKIPRNGWEYFATKLLHTKGSQELTLPLEVVLNFAGSFHELEDGNALFQMHENQYTRFDTAAQTPRSELFEVAAVVKQGRLQVRISYHRHIASERVEKWIQAFQAALEEACHILPSIAKQLTLADVPLLEIDYHGLDEMVKQVETVCSADVAIEIEDAYPCTGIQQGMLLSQAKNVAHYVTGTTWEVRVQGSVDRHRFLGAWQEVVQRHPALRTIFLESQAGQVWDQVVLRSTPGKVVVLDAHDPRPAAENIEHITPTCPWHLILREQGDGSLMCDFRVLHALVDGVSVGLIQQQISAAYEGKQLPKLTTGLRDYIAYVQDLPRGAATRYWADYLAGTEPCMVDLPNVSNDTKERGTGVKYVFQTIPSLAELREFCDRHGVTMFNLVQLAWAQVLKAYTGVEAPCFGYLVTGRNVPVADVERIVGPFINMVVCKVDLEGNRPIVETAQSIHSDLLQGLEHQHTALVEIFHELGLSGRGLFNTIVSLQTRVEEEGLQSEPLGLTMTPTTGDDPTEVRYLL
jgi:amino acid adenylation domain-containing protein/non-ribosomal peptide synthase protein (TIGR01720 family)